jgi:hypothetical protein
MKPLVLIALAVGIVVGYLSGSLGPRASAIVQAQIPTGQSDLRSVLLGQPAEGQYWDSDHSPRALPGDRIPWRRACGAGRTPSPC